MNKVLIVVALMMLPFVSSAVRLSGRAVAYAGNNLVVFTAEDYISNKRMVLGQTVITREGSFSVDINIVETRELQLVINSVEVIIYAEPGKDYEFTIPAFLPDKTAKSFDRITVEAAFQNLPDDDLNYLIRRFNGAYTVFVNEHYMDFAVDKYRGSEAYKVSNEKTLQNTGMVKEPCSTCPGEQHSPKEFGMTSFGNSVEEFRVNVDESMGRYMNNEFFADFAHYSIAQLELASGVKRQGLVEEYFFSQPFRHNNPAFVECFELFYSDILPSAAEGEYRDSMYKFVNSWKDYKMLSRFLAQRPDMAAEHVRYMTIITGMKKLIYNRSFLLDGITSILDGMAKGVADKQIALTAANALETIQRGQPGWPLEEFTLQDHRSSVVSLSSLHGKYVYVFFYAEWCSACLKELQIMEKLQTTYGKEITFLAISMDGARDEMLKHIQDNPAQTWTFLYGPSDPLIREKFNLRALPGTYLIDPEGRLMREHALRPSEGITKDFDKIKASVNKSGTEGSNTPKTWK